MGLNKNAIVDLSRAITRWGMLCERRTLSRIFSINLSSKSYESVSDAAGNRAREFMTEKVPNKMYNPSEKTGDKGKDNCASDDKDESIMENFVGDENELMQKVGKERGGKPVDEVKGLDVNWRPIDENKV
ncbi:long-chain-fatty-acid CoA ligase [Striga asiatica]|uniref:Long-chain-fatty-acid CoA ligase n=1 Tax=Striga asiatica TaxID=4170 RepID=A0A5A7NYV0_STRAF|nr:long-chain-fatty-acid CoA ligase [Striga asiatica]